MNGKFTCCDGITYVKKADTHAWKQTHTCLEADTHTSGNQTHICLEADTHVKTTELLSLVLRFNFSLVLIVSHFSELKILTPVSEFHIYMKTVG